MILTFLPFADEETEAQGHVTYQQSSGQAAESRPPELLGQVTRLGHILPLGPPSRPEPLLSVYLPSTH